MAVPVHFAARDLSGNITHLGGIGPRSTTWQLTKAEVMDAIRSGTWMFYTQGPQDKTAIVQLRDTYLVSSPDGIPTNNLDNLPTLVSPMGGAWPQSPMNFPSFVVPTAMTIRRARVRLTDGSIVERAVFRDDLDYGGTPLPQIDMTGSDRSGIGIAVDIDLPFPATYYVNVWTPDGRIANLTPRGQRLEEGTFGWVPGPSFLDNGGPHRLAEIRVTCGLPHWVWQQPAFILEIGYVSVNPYAQELFKGPALAARAMVMANRGFSFAAPQPPQDPNTTVPDCVGMANGDASQLLSQAGLKTQIFPVDLALGLTTAAWIVRTQTPAAGSTIARGRVVQLYCSPPPSEPVDVQGIKTLRLYNRYQQRRALQIWLYDVTTGQWSDKGSAAYNGGPVTVDLVDGHDFALFVADYALNSCQPAADRPPDLCVYKGPIGPLRGDSGGLVVDQEIS